LYVLILIYCCFWNARAVDYKAILPAAMDNDLFLSALEETDLHPHLREAVMGHELVVQRGKARLDFCVMDVC